MFMKIKSMMMVFTFLCMCWDASLANDESLSLKDVYEGSSYLAGNIFGATAWRTAFGVQFNQDLYFTEEYYGKSNSYALEYEYPVYYENSYCSIYGSGYETPKTAREIKIKTGSVYGVFSVRKSHNPNKGVRLHIIGGYFANPSNLFIYCGAIDNEISLSILEDLLDNVITFKAPISFKGLFLHR